MSAKTGKNIESILDAVIEKISEPKVFFNKDLNIKTENQELKALVFDSQYDLYRGVVSYVKVFSWEINLWDTLYFLNTNKKIEALDVGYFSPKYVSAKKIENGSVWYVVTWLKTIRDSKVWDTLWKPESTLWAKEKSENAVPIKWFNEVTPFVYAWIFPMSSDEYPQLRDSIEKLILNDSAISTESSVSPALGNGYRCWFLWLLHLDIVKERLFREFSMDVIMTSPQVTYRLRLFWDKKSEYNKFNPELVREELPTNVLDWENNKNAKGMNSNNLFTYIYISNPEDLPPREKYIYIEEPIAKIEIITPISFVWWLMQLSQERRWIFKNQEFIDEDRVMLSYELPMNELIWDFYDEIKSVSSGYASLNYEFIKFKKDDMVKLDILIADEKVEALAFITHKEQAHHVWWKICSKLKEVIPRALFVIKIQAAVWWKVVARESISAMRKDVTGYLYGWDVSRKKKLLEKQKKWKKRMKQFGKVELPSEAFINLLKK